MPTSFVATLLYTHHAPTTKQLSVPYTGHIHSCFYLHTPFPPGCSPSASLLYLASFSTSRKLPFDSWPLASICQVKYSCFKSPESLSQWPMVFPMSLGRVWEQEIFFFLLSEQIIFFIVVQLQLSQFSPVALPHPTHPPLPQSILTLLSMSMGPLYMFLD